MTPVRRPPQRAEEVAPFDDELVKYSDLYMALKLLRMRSRRAIPFGFVGIFAIGLDELGLHEAALVPRAV